MSSHSFFFFFFGNFQLAKINISLAMLIEACTIRHHKRIADKTAQQEMRWEAERNGMEWNGMGMETGRQAGRQAVALHTARVVNASTFCRIVARNL